MQMPLMMQKMRKKVGRTYMQNKGILRRSMMLLLITIFHMTSSTYACEMSVNDSSVTQSCEIVPYVNTVCDGLSYHYMVPRGIIGTVYNLDGSLYLNGNTWQCKNCYLIMVMQGDYYLGQMSTIGKYAIAYYNYQVDTMGCVVYGPNQTGYCGSNSLAGYKFFLS